MIYIAILFLKTYHMWVIIDDNLRKYMFKIYAQFIVFNTNTILRIHNLSVLSL